MKFSQFIKSDIDRVLDLCNLTKDEERVFVWLTKGKSIVEIADEMNVSSRTVDRKIKSIKDKIARTGGGEY